MGTNGLNLLKSYEKCPLKAYWDSLGKVWTIGWGHTANVTQGLVWTQLQADNTLKADMLAYGNTVNKYIHVPINQNQFDAMTDLCFNIGQSTVNGFPSSSVVRDFNNKNLAPIPNDFRLWDRAGGNVSAGLLRRRNDEVKLFLTPIKVNSTPAKTNNNTNAIKDAQKQAQAVKDNAKIKAQTNANNLAKANALKASEALKKAQLTKSASAIAIAQKAVDMQKKNNVVAPNTTKVKVLKSGMGILGLITLMFLYKGYDL
jgi:lysozyme